MKLISKILGSKSFAVGERMNCLLSIGEGGDKWGNCGDSFSTVLIGVGVTMVMVMVDGVSRYWGSTFWYRWTVI